MGFQKLPSNSRALLGEIVSTDNPVSLLCDKSKKASPQQYQELRGILRELQEKGYLEVLWANNKPYHVTVNNSARTYEEQLAEYEAREQVSGTQNITIGSNNKIKNSTIAGITNANGADTIKFQTVSLIFSLFLGDSIIAITLLSPCAVTPLSTHTLEVNL